MVFCRKCGAQIGDAAAFCRKCGAPQSAATPVTQPEPPRGLKACRECGREVSASAKTCPHCGAGNPGIGRALYAVLSIGSIVLVIFLWRACESTGPISTESSVSDIQPELSVDADTLVTDYKANEVAADEKYKGKVIEVNGMISSIGKDITDAIYVTLQVGDPDIPSFTSPQLFFSNEHENETAALVKGEPLRAKCLCEGKFMNILLKGCVIEAQQ